MSTQEPGRAQPGLTPLPRLEDLPSASDGFDRAKVQEAFDAFRRHVTSLQANLRVTGSGYDPHIEGAVEIRGGSFAVPDLGTRYTGLDTRVAEATQMAVHVAEDPLTCVVRGCGMIVEDLVKYERSLVMEQYSAVPR